MLLKLKAPMGGAVWKVLKNEGEQVKQGETVVILESMKMEIPVEAEVDGIVSKLFVTEGDHVEENANIAELE